MHAITEAAVRASFVNVSLRERKELRVPSTPDWDRLDFLGWRENAHPLLGFVVGLVDGDPLGVLLQQAERTPRARAQCSWCEDVQLPNDVVFFSARRAGAAGRKGDSIGSLVCAGFECSTNVRRLPTLAYVGYDREAERMRRIAVLRQNVANFLRRVAAD